MSGGWLSTKKSRSHVEKDNPAAIQAHRTKLGQLKILTNDFVVPKSSTRQKFRADMAIFHFLMTAPKWSLSLFLYLAAFHGSISNPYEAIRRPIERVQQAVHLESESYQRCTIDSVEILAKELQVAAQTECRRIELRHHENELRIHALQTHAEQCFDASLDVRNMLVNWQTTSGHDLHYVSDEELCSDDDKRSLKDSLNGELPFIEQEVGTLWEKYVQESLQGYSSLQNYAEERFQYDYDFFVGLRIQPALHLLGNFSRIQTLSLSIDSEGLSERIKDIENQLQNLVRSAEEDFKAIQSRLVEVSSSLNSFYYAYIDVYGRLSKGADFVADFLPPGVPLPKFLDIGEIPVADSLLPSVWEYHVFDHDFSATYHLIRNVTDNSMALIEEVVSSLRAQSVLAFQKVETEILETLIQILTLDGYEPPHYADSRGRLTTIPNEMILQENLAQATLEDTKLLLEKLRKVETWETANWESDLRIESPDALHLENSTVFGYLCPTLPTFPLLDIVVAVISFFLAKTWILEVSIQAFRLWRLEARYSKGSVPGIPRVKCVDGIDSAPEFNARVVALLTFLKTLLSPRLFLGAWIGMFALAVSGLWYPHLQDRCIDSQKGTTVATQFLSPILINEANAKGNARYLQTELQCFQTQRDICTQMKSQTNAAYLSHSSELAKFQAKQRKAEDFFGVIRSCLQTNTSLEINESCCGTKGFSVCKNKFEESSCPFDETKNSKKYFPPMDEFIFGEACNKGHWQYDILDEQFRCNILSETCKSVPCNGINEEALVAEIIRSDCEVQLYIFHLIKFFLIAAFHAVSINSICTLLFQGIRQLLWRRLLPTGILLTCLLNEDGVLVEERDRINRISLVNITVKRYELAGKIQITAGCIILYAWAFSFFFLLS